MRSMHAIQVKVTPELTLDFGTVEQTVQDGERGLLLTPAVVTPFEQLHDFLQRQPNPGKTHRSLSELDAVAATALCVRWGSYYAVLADFEHQSWRFDGSVHESIYDEEMARINIEASAAMSRWIDLYLSPSSTERAATLARRAVAYLPVVKRIQIQEGFPFWISEEEARMRTKNTQTNSKLQAWLQAAADAPPSRILGNAIIHHAYRNGFIERVHAGRGEGLPSLTPRITPVVDQRIQSETNGYLKNANSLLYVLATSADYRHQSWRQRAAPFLFKAIYWSTTESSRSVFLPLKDPA